MADTKETPAKTSSADNEKLMLAAATLPLIGLIIFYAMKDASPAVKNYCKQSTAVFAMYIVIFIVNMILTFIPFINILSCLTWFLIFVPMVAWIILLIKALQGEPAYKLPLIGDFFDKLMK
jgi:uncharacterized membrane protein